MAEITFLDPVIVKSLEDISELAMCLISELIRRETPDVLNDIYRIHDKSSLALARFGVLEKLASKNIIGLIV